ncbi:MAG: DNA adenine methylase [Vicinamibacterales bacterium]
MRSHPDGPSRPLLKWAGGKRQLLPILREWYPDRFARYVEPFFGSGAVFFDLAGSGVLAGRPALLADTNRDLIDCYEVVRDATEDVIAELARLSAEHRLRGNNLYYEVRDARFNAARAAGERRTPALAAMLIYLNRTGFNGLYRVNRRGDFNVPAGRYADPRICDADHLRTVAATLRTPGVTLVHASFDVPLEGSGRGDFVYCDPPYAPLSPSSSFAHYTAGGFTADDQARLQGAVVAAARRGATVLLSNSSAPMITRLYGSAAARAAGLRVRRVPARRAINSRAAGRGAVDELLVTNAQRTLAALPAPAMLRAALPKAARRRA